MQYEDTHLSNSKKTKLSIRKYLLFAICDVSRVRDLCIQHNKKQKKNIFCGGKDYLSLSNKRINVKIRSYETSNSMCHNSDVNAQTTSRTFCQIIELNAILKYFENCASFFKIQETVPKVSIYKYHLCIGV